MVSTGEAHMVVMNIPSEKIILLIVHYAVSNGKHFCIYRDRFF